MDSDESESPSAQEEDETDPMRMQQHKIHLLTRGLNCCYRLMTS